MKNSTIRFVKIEIDNEVKITFYRFIRDRYVYTEDNKTYIVSYSALKFLFQVAKTNGSWINQINPVNARQDESNVLYLNWR